jgi:hypothetical protein
MPEEERWYFISEPDFPKFPRTEFQMEVLAMLVTRPDCKASTKHFEKRSATLGFHPSAVICGLFDYLEDYAESGDPEAEFPDEWGKMAVAETKSQINTTEEFRHRVTRSAGFSANLNDVFPLVRKKEVMNKGAGALLDLLGDELAEREEIKQILSKPRDVEKLIKVCLAAFIWTAQPFYYSHILRLLNLVLEAKGSPERFTLDNLRQTVTRFYRDYPLYWGNMWRESLVCDVISVVTREWLGIDPQDKTAHRFELMLQWPQVLDQTVAILVDREKKYLKRKGYFRSLYENSDAAAEAATGPFATLRGSDTTPAFKVDSDQ